VVSFSHDNSIANHHALDLAGVLLIQSFGHDLRGSP
jgi:hypothetical protein